jgi:hypothetical protein
MKQYHDILRSILEHGTAHQDRTGVGTISHFGYQTRFDLRAGFPIVTSKRVPFRWVAEELFWFLSGDTNEANLQARAWIFGRSGPTKNIRGGLDARPATWARSTDIFGARSAATIRNVTASIKLRD